MMSKFQKYREDRKFRLELTIQAKDKETASVMNDMTALEKAHIQTILDECLRKVLYALHHSSVT